MGQRQILLLCEPLGYYIPSNDEKLFCRSHHPENKIPIGDSIWLAQGQIISAELNVKMGQQLDHSSL